MTLCLLLKRDVNISFEGFTVRSQVVHSGPLFS